MPSTTEHVTARDGTHRLVRRWAAPSEPWAHLLLLHGLGEHSGRYEAVGERLAGAGVAVEALDHVGFGGSDGPRGDVARWAAFHDDVEDRLARVREEAGARPTVLYGHSMGGLMALGYVLTDRPRPDLLVLSSPGLADALPAWKHALAGVLARIAPRMTVANGVAGEVLSRDPAVAAAYLADPRNVRRSTVRLGAQGFAEQARVQAALDRLDIPTYVFHGAKDRLVPPAASAPLEGRPDVTRVVLPGLRHETHNEPEGMAVVDGVIAWLRGSATIRGQPNMPPGSASRAESVVKPQTRGT
jgi:alpha-beta hydrolase superfamily lysophospholipase